jgi:hypothetical protein
MSVAQLESKLMSLAPNERREFARWFYLHEAEIVDWDDLKVAPHIKLKFCAAIARSKRIPALPFQ